ncbi:DUF6289 family protein [Thalassomonas actiniarum]|uniref:Uncharacterized protein n=1 Tax=Thalassomonas actiniarum TaxID=485447 RepID=A0AAE9YPU2_9GAMM|nr:DUF6289 family protein [Thalassomonas actiniarum]WDD98013.1 hypothetical protein SG35_022440 [Thalassomonas actiniarum]
MKSNLKKIAAIALTGITLSAASYAYAASSGYIKEFVYYSDASYSTPVGEKVVNQCRGTTYSSGQVTSYVRLVGMEMCGGNEF